MDDDGSLVNAIVVSWLPASESDFVDDDGKPAALYKIRYLDGELAGDHEDLEAHEVEESIGESIPMATLPQPAASRVVVLSSLVLRGVHREPFSSLGSCLCRLRIILATLAADRRSARADARAPSTERRALYTDTHVATL